MNRRLAPIVLVLVAVPAYVLAGNVTIPHVFTAGRVASASEVNANFDALAVAVNDNDTRLGALTNGGNADALHTHAGLGGTSRKLRVVQAYSATAAGRAVDVTGRGVLLALRFEAIANMSIVVTIDGDASPTPFTASSSLSQGGVYALPLGDGLVFSSGLKIDLVTVGAGASLSNLLIVYGVE